MTFATLRVARIALCADATLRVAGIALYPAHFVGARREKRLGSLLLSTAARNPGPASSSAYAEVMGIWPRALTFATLRVARIAL